MERTKNGNTVSIKRISAAETYPVRHPVLRLGKPLATCAFQGDDAAGTVHFGLYEGKALCGVVSVFRNDSPAFPDKSQIQLRGMAVLESHRGKGYGERLVRHAEKFAAESNAPLIWFNARVVAVPFYEKCGYEKIGGGFNIADIGLHYVMYKSAPDFR